MSTSPKQDEMYTLKLAVKIGLIYTIFSKRFRGLGSNFRGKWVNFEMHASFLVHR